MESVEGQFWSVVGSSHYPRASQVTHGTLLYVLKHPIPDHPWNIGVFESSTGEQIGTLNKNRIKKVYTLFPDAGYKATVEFIQYAKFALRPNLLKIRISGIIE
jgi:hypothetical protein